MTQNKDIILKDGLKVLIIGISKYLKIENAKHLKELEGVLNDVKSLEHFLLNEWKIPKENVCTLTDENGIVYYQDAITEIHQFFEKISSEDHVLFYYSGHGLLGEGEGKCYLTFSDSLIQGEKPNYKMEKVLPLQELNDLFMTCPAKIKLRVFDSCHSGESFSSLKPFFNQNRDIEETGIISRGLGEVWEEDQMEPMLSEQEVSTEEEEVLSTDMYAALMNSQKGWVTFCSCDINEVSWQDYYEDEDKVRSLFSFYLVKGLKGTEARRGDGPFYIEDLKLYVYQKVLKMSQKKKKRNPRYKTQHVQYQCSLSGNVRLD